MRNVQKLYYGCRAWKTRQGVLFVRLTVRIHDAFIAFREDFTGVGGVLVYIAVQRSESPPNFTFAHLDCALHCAWAPQLSVVCSVKILLWANPTVCHDAIHDGMQCLLESL